MINSGIPAQVRRIFVLTAFLLAAIQMTASADDRKDCELFNYTDRTINEIYMCAAGYDIDKFGTNMLEGMQPLKNGEGVPMQYPAEHRYYNFKIVFDNGEVVLWENLDCNGMSRITLFNDGENYLVRTN